MNTMRAFFSSVLVFSNSRGVEVRISMISMGAGLATKQANK